MKGTDAIVSPFGRVEFLNVFKHHAWVSWLFGFLILMKKSSSLFESQMGSNERYWYKHKLCQVLVDFEELSFNRLESPSSFISLDSCLVLDF